MLPGKSYSYPMKKGCSAKDNNAEGKGPLGFVPLLMHICSGACRHSNTHTCVYDLREGLAGYGKTLLFVVQMSEKSKKYSQFHKKINDSKNRNKPNLQQIC